MRELSKLRSRRFVSESNGNANANDKSLSKNAAAAIPNATSYKGGDAYFHYRALVMAASLPDPPRIPAYSFTEDQPFSVGYTDADQEMIDAAAKLCGFPGKRISSSKSKEGDDVHKISPTNNNSGKHPR